MKDKQENKELNEERKHTKRVLEKSTRVDLRNKKQATGKYFLCKLCYVYRFNWND